MAVSTMNGPLYYDMSCDLNRAGDDSGISILRNGAALKEMTPVNLKSMGTEATIAKITGIGFLNR